MVFKPNLYNLETRSPEHSGAVIFVSGYKDAILSGMATPYCSDHTKHSRDLPSVVPGLEVATLYCVQKVRG